MKKNSIERVFAIVTPLTLVWLFGIAVFDGVSKLAPLGALILCSSLAAILVLKQLPSMERSLRFKRCARIAVATFTALSLTTIGSVALIHAETSADNMVAPLVATSSGDATWSYVTIDETSGRVTATIQGVAPSGCNNKNPGESKSGQIVIKNTSTEKDYTLDISDCKVDKDGAGFSIDGSSVSNKSVSLVKNGGSEVVITVTSLATDEKVTLTFNYTVSEMVSNFEATVVYDNALGLVRTESGEIASGTTQNADASAGLDLTAVPNPDTTFLGWINDQTGEILSQNLEYKLRSSKAITVRAAFSDLDTAAWFKVGSFLFADLTQAVTCANNSATKTIVLAANGTLNPGDYVVSKGITLLIPFDDENTLITTTNVTEKVYGDHTTHPAKVEYRRLHMPDGANITVASGGSINVGSKTHPMMVGQTASHRIER